MGNVSFAPSAWREYTEWTMTDKKIAKRINELIKDIQRNGVMQGIGKPEALKHRKAYSRRITDEHRLIYATQGDSLLIVSCKGHYDDR